MHPAVYPVDSMYHEPFPPPPLDGRRRFLCEGDSWFTLGTLKASRLSNLLFQLNFAKPTAIVNCAYPGDTLKHMVDSVEGNPFNKLLYVKGFTHSWDGILMSAGGNDFIDALNARIKKKDGKPVDRKWRLLLRPDEVRENSHAGPKRYTSPEGWATLTEYLLSSFTALVQRRDLGPNKGRPIFVHTYAKPTVRKSGVLFAPEGWIYPAFVRYSIPPDDRQALCDLLFAGLRSFLLGLDCKSGGKNALPYLHVFDSASIAIRPADKDAKGESGDWINEIHLTPKGYAKLGSKFGPWIESLLH